MIKVITFLNKGIIAIVFGSILLSSCFSGKKVQQERVVTFYNVENLFDTLDNPNTHDEEFMPNTDKNWNTERYNKKLSDLAKVLSLTATNGLPDFVGLCEVENRMVVEDLMKTEPLSGYSVVHKQSPDFRGIDVAFAYRTKAFKPTKTEWLTVKMENDSLFKTRDILYVSGNLGNETLHFFVNHWSSRRGGEQASEPKRVKAASIVRAKVDEILKNEPNAKIVIMGDMNDEPLNRSLSETLGASNPEIEQKSTLYNLCFPKDLKDIGTYNYRGNWNMLDNMVVSAALLNSDKGYKVHGSLEILKDSFMLYTNPKSGDVSPSKTYGGPNYYGGISDHLPICIKLSN